MLLLVIGAVLQKALAYLQRKLQCGVDVAEGIDILIRKCTGLKKRCGMIDEEFEVLVCKESLQLCG